MFICAQISRSDDLRGSAPARRDSGSSVRRGAIQPARGVSRARCGGTPAYQATFLPRSRGRSVKFPEVRPYLIICAQISRAIRAETCAERTHGAYAPGSPFLHPPLHLQLSPLRLRPAKTNATQSVKKSDESYKIFKIAHFFPDFASRFRPPGGTSGAVPASIQPSH